MKPFASLRMEKRKEFAGLGSHIDRKHQPRNVDASRTGLNQEMVPEKATIPLGEAIDQVSKKGYTGKRALRKGCCQGFSVPLNWSAIVPRVDEMFSFSSV